MSSDGRCPNCTTTFSAADPSPKNMRQVPFLEIVEHDYSGYGVDIAECPVCKKLYQISYRIDAITPLGPEWET